MPKLDITITHNLTPQEAVRRIKKDLEEFKVRFAGIVSKFSAKWEGNTAEFKLTALGFSGSGNLDVRVKEIKLTGKIPFAAILLKGQIESAIRERAEAIFK